MAIGKFHHFGVPTQVKYDGAAFIDGAKVYVTDPEKHPYRVEFVRFEADSPMPAILKTTPHAAYVVPNLTAALNGKKIIIEPFDATPTLRCAFIMDGDAVLELMEEKK